MFPISKHTVVVVVVAVSVPVLPLLLTEIPLIELLRHLSSVALGRLAE